LKLFFSALSACSAVKALVDYRQNSPQDL